MRRRTPLCDRRFPVLPASGDPFRDWSWNQPPGETGDLRDFTFPALIEPRSVGRCDWDAEFAAHFDPPGHASGHLVFGGEQIPVGCYALRDRSWGPRVGNPDFRPGGEHGQTATDALLS